jgi:polyferredoxin
VGTIAEGLWRLGRKVFGFNLVLPKFVDWPLMTLKYLVLGFFVKVILIDMPGEAAAAFANGPYNKIADVKMLYFFLDLSSTAASVLLALTILSVIVKNFWCRYLCPYGALLGIASLFSPLKVTRNEKLCIDCKACNRACPANLKVASSRRVWSPECMSCLDCIVVCPKKGALEVRGSAGTPQVRPELFPALLIGTFLAAIVVAQVFGYWQTSITPEEFAELIPIADQFSH